MPTRQVQDSTTDARRRETVARLEAILASTLDPIITIDAYGVIQSASNSIERVFGYAPEELVGRNVSVLMPTPHREQHDQYLEQYRQTGQTHILGETREFDALHRDGHRFPIELSVSRVDVPGQAQPLFTGIIHDITERRRAEEEIRLLQTLTIAIGSASDATSAFDFALQSICDVTGWVYAEAWTPDGDGNTMVLGASHVPSEPRLDRFRAAGRRLQLSLGNGLAGQVWQAGTTTWFEDLSTMRPREFHRSTLAADVGLRSALAIPILAGEQVVAVLVFFMTARREENRRQADLVAAAVAPLGAVVQRKQFEDALHESERRFRDMLSNVDILAVMLDQSGNIVFADEYLLRLSGWTRQEILHRNWFELFIPLDDRDRVQTIFRNGMQRGHIIPHAENEIMRRNGERRMISWSNTVMRDVNGHVIGATALGVDITDQRRAERALAQHSEELERVVAERTVELERTHEQLRMADRLASIGTLAAGLGHDMNNVLLAARCNLDALDAAVGNPAAREQTRSLRRSISYLQQLTDGLRLFALDPTESHSPSETTDASQWWGQIGPLLSRAVPKHVAFSAIVPGDLRPIAVAPHRLTQAVLNLIVNAGEAVEKGGRVRLRLCSIDDGRLIRLSVVDNGSGMTADVRRHALDPFFTTKTRKLGTGLGLSLVRGVAQSAGGAVHIISTPGRGTSVVLLLPTATDDASARKPIADGAAPKRALISIADPHTASLIAAMLHANGIEVCHDSVDAAERVDVWVAEPTGEHLRTAAALGTEVSPELLWFGALPADWAGPPFGVIDDRNNFESIRNAIGDVVQRMTERAT